MPSWIKLGSLRGPQGFNGKDGESIQGPPGRDGKDGKDAENYNKVHYSVLIPKNDIGEDGDWCFCETNEILRKEKGKWIFYKTFNMGSGGGGGGGGSGAGITELTGDVTAIGPGIAAATLATVNANVGSFGSASQVPVITVNGKGLITAVTNTAIAISAAAVSGLATVATTGAHSDLSGLTTGDPHTQYALLAGRSGDQTLTGGTAASNNLILRSTSNATKGAVLFDETTSASSRSTGAVVIGDGTSGGLGVGGRIHSGGLTTYSTILADTNQTRDIGSRSTRFRSANINQLSSLYENSTGGTTTLSNTAGTDIGSYIVAAGGDAGTRTINLNGGGFLQFTAAQCVTQGDSGTSATINNRANGTIVLGGVSTFASSLGNTSTIDMDGGNGTTVIGYAYCNGSTTAASNSTITGNGLGSVFIGACGSTNFGLTGGNSTAVTLGNDGIAVFGLVACDDVDSCIASMSASSRGSLIAGMVYPTAGASGITAQMNTSGTGGATVLGFVARGVMEATNQGAFARGYLAATSDTAAIRASGLASIAFGRAINSGSIVSSSNASFVSGNSNGTGTITGSGSGSFTVFTTTSSANSTNSGAGALMAAQLASSGAITQSGAGSIVVTQANSTGTVTVSAAGSMFVGRVNSSGNASVTGTAGNFAFGDAGTVGMSVSGAINCGLFGQGSNSITDSVKFGETIRILELQSASLASNGDVGMDSSGIVNIRSNSINRNIQKLYQNTNFSVTSVGNVGTGVDDLISHTLAASQLTVDGDYARHSGFGTLAANVNLKQVRALWNGTEVVTTGAVAINGGTWESMITIVRVSSTNARCFGRITVKDGAGVVTTYYGNATIATTWTGTVIAKHTGEATSNNDIVQETGHLDIVRVS